MFAVWRHLWLEHNSGSKQIVLLSALLVSFTYRWHIWLPTVPRAIVPPVFKYTSNQIRRMHLALFYMCLPSFCLSLPNDRKKQQLHSANSPLIASSFSFFNLHFSTTESESTLVEGFSRVLTDSSLFSLTTSLLKQHSSYWLNPGSPLCVYQFVTFSFQCEWDRRSHVGDFVWASTWWNTVIVLISAAY